MKTFYIQTFGCQMNVADSDEMSRAFLERGWAVSATPEGADCVVVNTCTVRDHAEHRALSYLGRLRDWKAQKAGRQVIVAGCAAERLKDDLVTRFPHVDRVVGAKSIDLFSNGLDLVARPQNDAAALAVAPPATGFVTVMRGCNFSCSYCIVPSVRGRERYRPFGEIETDLGQKALEGAVQIMLVGQTVNSYEQTHQGGRVDFSDVLRRANQTPSIQRIRFMSPHPFFMTDRLVQTMAECDKVCPHIHLPVQSGADRVLKAMRRSTTRAGFVNCVEKLRRAIPGMAVTTDFIVGYPSETEADFLETLSLARLADVDGAYCFKYSHRPGTPAAAEVDDVPRALKEERLARLLEVTSAQSQKKVALLSGTTQNVMVERVVDAQKQEYEGMCRTFWKIKFCSDTPLRVGNVVDVRVGAVEGRSLTGKRVEQHVG